MRWWQRLIVTLLLGPVVWRLVAMYLANQTGASAADLWLGAPALLGKIYLVYSLPALAVIVVILVPIERALKALGLDLLTVAVAPLLTTLVAYALVMLLHDPRLPQELLALSAAYGLVWGLSIREPRHDQRANLAR